jgi:hypothetical protein
MAYIHTHGQNALNNQIGNYMKCVDIYMELMTILCIRLRHMFLRREFFARQQTVSLSHMFRRALNIICLRRFDHVYVWMYAMHMLSVSKYNISAEVAKHGFFSNLLAKRCANLGELALLLLQDLRQALRQGRTRRLRPLQGPAEGHHFLLRNGFTCCCVGRAAGLREG